MTTGTSLTINVSGDRDLQEMLDRVTGPQAQQRLNQTMGEAVREKVREHLMELAATRHTTAEKLGAAPSGHWEQGARAVEGTPVDATTDSATVTINHPGIGRALHDVDIYPIDAKYLTLAINALSYAHRAGEFDLKSVFLGRKPVFLIPKDVELPKKPWGLAELILIRSLSYFLLAKSAHQRQDPSLLPTELELTDAAKAGAESFFNQDMDEVGA